MNILWLFRREMTFFCCFLMIAAIMSYFIGYFLHIVILISFLVIVYQAISISRLEIWLSTGAIGKVPTASGIWNDIYYHLFRIKKTEKQRKKKLGKIINRFQNSINALPDAAVVLGDQDEIEWSNKLAKSVLGITKSDKGQRIDNLIRAPEFSNFLKNRNKKISLTLSAPIDDNIILQYRIVSYGIAQHLVIAHDVTQQKKIETMRKTFVDNISHELKTPLTVLKGYIETLLEFDESQSVMLRNSLTQMGQQTDRMQYLIDDLLLLARLETTKSTNKAVHIKSLIRDICFENAIVKNNQRIELNMESNSNIYGEETDLRCAISNLLINALKYSADTTSVKVIWKKTAEGMVLDVIDQGEGIAPSDLPRVTERFFRANRKRKKKLAGTGLGLAIVKHVLIRHDAKLEISSKLGKGSQFRCIFPVSRIVN